MDSRSPCDIFWKMKQIWNGTSSLWDTLCSSNELFVIQNHSNPSLLHPDPLSRPSARTCETSFDKQRWWQWPKRPLKQPLLSAKASRYASLGREYHWIGYVCQFQYRSQHHYCFCYCLLWCYTIERCHGYHDRKKCSVLFRTVLDKTLVQPKADIGVLALLMHVHEWFETWNNIARAWLDMKPLPKHKTLSHVHHRLWNLHLNDNCQYKRVCFVMEATKIHKSKLFESN